MGNDKAIWRVTVRYPDGKDFVTLLVESERIPEEPPGGAASPTAAQPAAGNPAPERDGEPRMTEPQKRYLFRLLAEKGIEGKQAEEHLKQRFNVRALREVSKATASQVIDRMVAERKDATDGRT
jgi:hypothetical protein